MQNKGCGCRGEEGVGAAGGSRLDSEKHGAGWEKGRNEEEKKKGRQRLIPGLRALNESESM